MKQTFIIAEAGVNHNGDVDLAYSLVEAASKAGADAVKFQTFKADKLVNKNAAKAEYQKRSTDAAESQYDMLKRLELSEEAHFLLAEKCRALGIMFLSTPFDLESLIFLNSRLRVQKIKFSSGDITNGPLLLEAAKTGKPIILSTGMSTLGEIEDALAVLAYGYTNSQEPPSKEAFYAAYGSSEAQELLKEKVTLLHCTTEYPAPFDEVNLRCILTLRDSFGLRTGFSDHTEGIAVPVAAAALGVDVIEKHFTLDRSLPGPDHKASLEPDELELMIRSIRQVELAMGIRAKRPTPSERKNIRIARKSLYALEDIGEGQTILPEQVTVKRPGDGRSPMDYWELTGKLAQRTYRKDDHL
ncbi:N-acetylneuraminate synthase [Paenibacillus alkalitolerans]|uniref:N-acetylneuraminate synthase n=1 Tax=Paenibacillus alkalitolerans TaxID=2799335 RepID=UPI0018F3B648|nr:N-acetylneuraminate synthase [Paenibacillus alkalitolerans]